MSALPLKAGMCGATSDVRANSGHRRQHTRNARLRRPAIKPGEHSMERAVATGTVKWFNPTKGYGFIQPQSGGKDVFVHISALERAGLSTLNEGATVDYEIVSDRGKESAGNLKVR
jgi:CspA family cold shock protein